METTRAPDPADHHRQDNQQGANPDQPDQDEPPGHHWFTVLTETLKPGLTALHQDCTCTNQRTIHHRTQVSPPMT